MTLVIPFKCPVCGRVERVPLENAVPVPICHEKPMQVWSDPDLQEAVDAIMGGISQLVVAALSGNADPDSNSKNKGGSA